MELIVAAALCSVLVSIVLKICKAKGFNLMQMITCNYAIASLLCWWWFKPDVSQISWHHTPWWLIVLLSVLLPSLFLCLAKSLQTAGVLKTEIAQRLSVILSLCAAYFFFQEQFNLIKIIGIALGGAAIFCLLFQRHQLESASDVTSAGRYLVLVWFGYALVDVLLKYTTSLGVQFALALNLMFVGALICSMIYLCCTSIKINHWATMIWGSGLGVLNFANIALYVQAHILLKQTPAIVFAGMNMLVMAFGVVASLLIFKESCKPSTVLGLCLAFISVICLAYAMQSA